MRRSVNGKIILPLVAVVLIAADFACSYRILSPLISENRNNYPSIRFLDVGQGDAELVSFTNGAMVLTDAGPNGPAILGALDPIFGKRGRSIDLVIVSQPSAAHFGGLSDVLDHYHVGAIVYNGRDAPPGVPAWAALLQKISALKVPLITLGEGDSVRIGEKERIEIVSPGRERAESPELADTGIVQLVQTRDFRAILAADIGFGVENALVARYGPSIRADILKVAHNGSKSSSGETFLSAVLPRTAVIEVGEKNSYHQPSPEAIARIASSTSAKVFRTDEDGTIEVFRAGEGTLSAKTAR